MKVLLSLIKRNTKLFFKDKAMFLTSLITPLILILLFVTFLGNVYRDSFNSSLPEGMNISKSLIEGFIGGWLFSSLLSVSCVTIAFCSNLLMIQDKADGILPDLTIAPIKKTTLSLGYFISSALVTLIICYLALIVGFIYLACVGWYLSFVDVILIIIDVFILVLFGTSLSSLINYFLKTQGQMSAVGTLISTGYGFICGAYMPMSQFGITLQRILMFLPGSYGTSLMHSHFMRGVIDEFGNNNFPQEVIDGIKKNFDAVLYFFDHKVENWMSYIVIILSVVLFIGAYILINIFSKRKERS